MANPIAIPGTVVSTGALVSPGGPQGVQGPGAVSTDANNLAVLGSDSFVYVPQSSITLLNTRRYNAVGNPNFEIDQRNAGSSVVSPASGTAIIDRWFKRGAGTYAVTMQQVAPGSMVPGGTFRITQRQLNTTLTAQQASLGATDSLLIGQYMEGIHTRELFNDVFSVSLIVQSTVAPLKFGVGFTDPAGSYAIVNLATLSTASTWTLIQIPNWPAFSTAPAGNGYGSAIGALGAIFNISLACGTSYTVPVNGVYTNSASPYYGAVGQDNFCGKATSSVFSVAFVQIEPGSVCTTPMDLDFQTNLWRCQRYYSKSYDYGTKAGTVANNGMAYVNTLQSQNALCYIPYPVRMAKVPTVSPYSPNTGAINNVRDNYTATDRASGGASFPGDTGFSGFGITTVNTAVTYYGFHWVADTAW